MEEKIMKLTDNVHILKWVDEMAALTKPEKIVWIDGSEEQLEQLRAEAMGTGELIKKIAPLSAPSVRRMQVRPTTGWILRRCTKSCMRYSTAR